MLVRRLVVVVLAVVAASAWSIRPVDAVGVQTAARWWLDFGDDDGKYVRDGECDDPRFEGPAAAADLRLGDRGHDATDCRRLWEAGRVRLAGVDLIRGRVDFGDDASEWARDGECDDPRFEGPGVDLFLFHEDRGRDATDCRRLWQEGSVRLFGVYHSSRP